MESVTCKLCRRQFGRYTCPTCNIPYCSLACFRSEAHSECSEMFYRKEIESDIHTQPSKSTAERSKMMDLLKRFEEESRESQTDSLDGKDGPDLAKRLQGLDLESTPSDTIWSVLTSEERNKFLKASNDPSSELAQQLLASEELEWQRQEPWWEAPALGGDEVQSGTTRQFGLKPETIKIPSEMMKSPPHGPFLIYNLCAICIAYAHATRYLSVSPLSLASDSVDSEEARRIVSQLVPFLVERKATTLYPSLSSVVTDTWSRFDSGTMTTSYLSILLRDSACLLRPTSVSVVSRVANTETNALDLDTHPHITAILVLSDISKLFENAGSDRSTAAKRLCESHVKMKLLFYCAHMLSTRSSILNAIADEVIAEIGGLS